MNKNLIDQNYQITSPYVICAFIGTLCMAILAFIVTNMFPIVEIPYIGSYYQTVLNPLLAKDIISESSKYGLLFSLNIIVYWCVFLITMMFVVNTFFKELIGYKVGWKRTIKNTIHHVFRNGLIYGGLIVLFVFSFGISIPLSDWYITKVHSKNDLVIQITMPLIFCAALYYGMKELVLWVIKQRNKTKINYS